MARLPAWILWLSWAASHLVVAIMLVLCLVDYSDLIRLSNLPPVCEGAVKMQGYLSPSAFVLRCWDPAQAAPYIGAALLVAIAILSPFTIGFIVLRRKRRRLSPNARE
jgi:hypothetical protein